MTSVRSVTARFLTCIRCGSAWLRLVMVMALLSTSACAWLDQRERQLIYRPSPGEPAHFAGLRPGDERYVVPVPVAPGGQHIAMWWLPQADKNAPTLLYLHGTFLNLYGNLHKIEALREAGFSVLAVDYRGWGLSTPITPTEHSIVQDADVAWAELQRREPRAARRVIYGHSMGSAVAVDLASRLHVHTDYSALILESAFTSFAGVAHEAGWVAQWLAWFSPERFDSLAKIDRVQGPLLMIHGSLDTTVPMPLGQQLFAAAHPPKQWLTIEGGAHADLDEMGHATYMAGIQRFMNDYVVQQPVPDSLLFK